MVPTLFTTLGAGTLTSYLAEIISLAAWIVGSTVLQGHIFFDTTISTNPAIYANTGAIFQSWDGQAGTTCTNTGGLAKYTSCYGQNPSSTNSGVILDIGLDTEKMPVGTTATCMTTPLGPTANAVQTGSVIIKYATASSGTTLLPTAYASGHVLVPPNWYIRCNFGETPGELQAKLRVQTRGYFVP